MRYRGDIVIRLDGLVMAGLVAGGLPQKLQKIRPGGLDWVLIIARSTALMGLKVMGFRYDALKTSDYFRLFEAGSKEIHSDNFVGYKYWFVTAHSKINKRERDKQT